ncbi:MAG: glycosyltransferase family 4 protein [Desulfobulbus oligotrophicus]|jgi:glycosyltransferase involved in cell wall biosynthesis|nr:glycosyltransferase family 4 protein [Desulfobulbus oligotrophicus]
MKKHVLLIVRWPVGGIRTFLRYVYRNFDPEQWRFTLLAPELSEVHVLLEEDLPDHEFTYLPVEENPSAMVFTHQVIKALGRHRYDLVHSHGLTAGLCAALPVKLRRVPHVLTLHDVINASQVVGFKGRLKKVVIGQLLGLIDSIHSVSQDTQDNLLTYFPRLPHHSPQAVVIRNGIEVARFQEETVRDLRSELGLTEEHFLIGFLGRFMSQKGFRYLVEAMELLVKETDLPKTPVVVTFSDGGFVREEKAAVAKQGLDSSFYFLPFTPNVAATIRGLDVVAMPSLWEACALLPMETLVCGTPFIGTNCIGLREVIRDTPAITVPAADATALHQALSREIRTNSKAKFAAFRQHAAERYCVSRASVALQELYQELLP